MIEIEVSGIEELTSFASRMQSLLSPAMLTARTLSIAREAGHLLLIASVRACIEAVYDHPNFPTLYTTTPSKPGSDSFGGNEAERTNALLDAHELVDEGLSQIVQVDPDAAVELGSHSGRERVIDYAIPVHEGYTQWVYGRNTGVFHPGRFWFDVAAHESGQVILAFVQVAFFQTVEELFSEAAA